MVAFFVNRGWPAAGYEIRRKTSSGGQRIWLDSVVRGNGFRSFSNWRERGAPRNALNCHVCTAEMVARSRQRFLSEKTFAALIGGVWRVLLLYWPVSFLI